MSEVGNRIVGAISRQTRGWDSVDCAAPPVARETMLFAALGAAGDMIPRCGGTRRDKSFHKLTRWTSRAEKASTPASQESRTSPCQEIGVTLNTAGVIGPVLAP